MCLDHLVVQISGCGSWVDDRHADGGPRASRSVLILPTIHPLSGDSGAERFTGLLQPLHTLRSPDVGNHIEEGKLPQIPADALPPLNEGALNSAG